MQNDFSHTPVMQVVQSPEGLLAAEQPFNRRARVVDFIPFFAVPRYPRVLANLCQPDFFLCPLGRLAFLPVRLLAPLVEVNQGDCSEFVHHEGVVVEGIVASIGVDVLRVDSGVPQRPDEVLHVALVGWRDFHMDRQFMGSIADHVGLVAIPPVVMASLLLESPRSVFVRPLLFGLAAVGMSVNVSGVYGYYLPEVLKMFLENVNGLVDSLLNQVEAHGQPFGDEAGVGGFGRYNPRSKAAYLAERGVVLKAANEGGYAWNVENVGHEVAAPEGFDGIALAATLPVDLEGCQEFFIIKGIEDALQLGNNGRNTGLILRKAEFIIVGDHRKMRPSLVVQRPLGIAVSSGLVLFVRTSVLYHTSHVNGLERIFTVNYAAKGMEHGQCGAYGG
jgi:hypothetical protein